MFVTTTTGASCTFSTPTLTQAEASAPLALLAVYEKPASLPK